MRLSQTRPWVAAVLAAAPFLAGSVAAYPQAGRVEQVPLSSDGAEANGVLGSSGPGAAATAPNVLSTPRCPVVLGAEGAVTYLRPQDASASPTAPPMRPVTYAQVATLRTAMVALVKDTVQWSVDSGCTWVPIGAPELLDQFRLATGSGDVAYAYSEHDPRIYRVAGATIEPRTGPGGMVGLSVAATDSERMRAVGADGEVWDSHDGGRGWVEVGSAPAGVEMLYDAAINPSDLDQIVIGTVRNGAWTSGDGGRSWRASKGLVRPDSAANVFTTAISPADWRTIWLQGYDLAESGPQARKIWLSTNGGKRFREVLDGGQARLTNGIVMAPSPEDADVLTFVFGTWFGGYGTDIYRYDDELREVTRRHLPFDDVSSLAFNRADPDVMYLGLAEER